jgi:hypothetical protein
MKIPNKRTLDKLARWKESDQWQRININFTTRELESLESYGHIKRGLFNTIEETIGA